MQLKMSRALWASCNPAYYVRDGRRLVSTMKDTFTWDDEEIDFMRQQRLCDKTHNRRRDDFTRYVECKALIESTSKGGK